MGKTKDKVEVICLQCGKVEKVRPSRAKTYKTCSIDCMAKAAAKRLDKKVNKVCPICNNKFKVKNSQTTRRKYCSKTCQAEAYKQIYLGKANPNYKGHNDDWDGYMLSQGIDGKRVKLHRQVVQEFLGLTAMPKDLKVHHRDCDKWNNSVANLVLLNHSDHVWLHKQFGNATLWAFCKGKVSFENLVSWSDDIPRAKRLLTLSIREQQSAVVKIREFRGSPEVDNPEPSLEGDFFEGATHSSESDKSDNNSTTSAGRLEISDDVC